MPSLAVVVVLAFATFRLARLVAIDSLTLPFRERIYDFAWTGEFPDGSARPEPVARAPWRTYVYELVTCPHCIGVWWAIAVYCAWRWGGDVALGIIAVIAIAGAQSALSSFAGKADE